MTGTDTQGTTAPSPASTTDGVGRIGDTGTRRAAVLGSPIEHSLSPALHLAAYDGLGLRTWSYHRFEVREPDLARFVEGLDESWAGLSLTMPLKRVVFDLADEVSQTAHVTHSANTLILDPGRTRPDGRPWRHIHNTDVAGVVGAFADVGLHGSAVQPGRAVVLGGGATAASALAALHQLGWQSATMCVRSVERSWDVLQVARERLGIDVTTAPLSDAAEQITDAQVVIATVPGDALAGLGDIVRLRPSPTGVLPVLLDVVYDPWPTHLAQAWQNQGGAVVSGLDMLIHQAVDQVVLMTGLTPDVDLMKRAVGR